MCVVCSCHSSVSLSDILDKVKEPAQTSEYESSIKTIKISLNSNANGLFVFIQTILSYGGFESSMHCKWTKIQLSKLKGNIFTNTLRQQHEEKQNMQRTTKYKAQINWENPAKYV